MPCLRDVRPRSCSWLYVGIFFAGLLTVGQFSFWGNYLPRAYPVHFRGTGESFAANIGGRLDRDVFRLGDGDPRGHAGPGIRADEGSFWCTDGRRPLGLSRRINSQLLPARAATRRAAGVKPRTPRITRKSPRRSSPTAS